jgi:mitotic spindle assembly checkpoint protein MAD2
VYTEKNVEVPITWENSDPRMIQNSQQVKLRGFDTTTHRVDTSVAYKLAE